MPTYPSYQNVLTGQGTQGGSGPWGAVPTVPNPVASAGQAIAGDLTNFPGLQSLASQVNQFNTGQAIAPYIANLPDYQNMVAQSSANISDLLAGRLPTDVESMLAQKAAERGVAGGMPGSPNANAAYLRALGLTSLQEQQQGEQNLTAAIQRTPVPQLFNVASYLTSPADMQAAQMAANMYQAAPNPAQNAQALMDLLMKGVAAGRGGVGGTSYGMAPPASGGFDAGTGGPPQVGPVGALGPFTTNRGTTTGGSYSGNTLGWPGVPSYNPNTFGGMTMTTQPPGGEFTAQELASMFPGMSLQDAQGLMDYGQGGAEFTPQELASMFPGMSAQDAQGLLDYTPPVDQSYSYVGDLFPPEFYYDYGQPPSQDVATAGGGYSDYGGDLFPPEFYYEP